MVEWGASLEGKKRIDAGALSRHVAALFESLGVRTEEAAIAADVLVRADLLGVDSHGVSNYVQLIYEPGLSRGWIRAAAEIEIVRRSDVSALIDGGGGLGLVVGTRSMRLAIDLARTSGVGIVSVRNSRHYGMAGYYALMAAEQDMIGISLTDSPPLVLPTWGRERRLGTNPIAVAIPAAEQPWFLLDMATSTVPFGKLMLALRDGRSLPAGWAADEAGNPTTDANVAVRSRSLLPLGGSYEQSSHKGYGLAALVAILTGVLSGGVQIGEPEEGLELGGSVNHFFAAIRLDLFRSPEEIRRTMDAYLESLLRTPPVAGEERVVYPGFLEAEIERDRVANGIPLHEKVIGFLNQLAERQGVDSRL